MNFSKLAEQYIGEHNSPILKKELFGSKLFLSALDAEQQQCKEKCINGIESILRHNRVDRRVARSIAEWLPEENVAKVVKMTGALQGFGFQNKNGKFLNANETLFLLETNKLELMYKSVPMSIQQAFKNVKNLGSYQVYKTLLLQGYKLKPVKKEAEKLLGECSDSGEPPAKVAKLEDETGMGEIFQRLRENGPKTTTNTSSVSPDYYVHMPGTSERVECFNLIIDDGTEFTSNKVDEKNSNIYALSTGDNVAFYKFYNTNIPIL